MVPRRRTLCRSLTAAVAIVVAACAPTGTKATGNLGEGLPPELLFCRADATVSTIAEIAARTAQNLGTTRVAERSGRELHVRAHPTGTLCVFTRERTPGDASTREIWIADRTGTVPDLRLTTNDVADDHPCWSPDGSRVLFVSERGGERRLWTAAADGSDQREFLAAGVGTRDDDPDWSSTIDRIVFSRREPGGLRRLYLVNGNGTGLAPLTTGSTPADPELGVREPAFSPDGTQIVCAQVVAADIARLFVVDVGTGAEQLLFEPQGDVRMPRFAKTGDRIFCALAQPLLGRQGRRLAVVPATGGEALLVEPSEQWICHGVDPLPTIAAAPIATLTEIVPIGAMELQVSSGAPVGGGRNQLAAEDNSSFVLATQTFGDHEIAGINCVYDLPVAAAEEVLAVRVRIVASVSRSDAATTLRTSLHDPVDKRFDTVAELPAPGTGMRQLGFATQSLAHVSLQRQVRVTVIGEIGAGARATLSVDHVQLEIVRRATPVR